MKVSSIPFLIFLSLITCAYLLILVGSSASHAVIFGMDLECYRKTKILIFITFLLSSAMERELHSISSIETLKEHVCRKMPISICSHIYGLIGRAVERWIGTLN